MEPSLEPLWEGLPKGVHRKGSHCGHFCKYPPHHDHKAKLESFPHLVLSRKSRCTSLPHVPTLSSRTGREFVPWRAHQAAFQWAHSALLTLVCSIPQPVLPARPDLARGSGSGPCGCESVPLECQPVPRPYAVWAKALFTVNITAELTEAAAGAGTCHRQDKSWDLLSLRPREAGPATDLLLSSLDPTTRGH